MKPLSREIKLFVSVTNGITAYSSRIAVGAGTIGGGYDMVVPFYDGYGGARPSSMGQF